MREPYGIYQTLLSWVTRAPRTQKIVCLAYEAGAPVSLSVTQIFCESTKAIIKKRKKNPKKLFIDTRFEFYFVFASLFHSCDVRHDCRARYREKINTTSRMKSRTETNFKPNVHRKKPAERDWSGQWFVSGSNNIIANCASLMIVSRARAFRANKKNYAVSELLRVFIFL